MTTIHHTADCISRADTLNAEQAAFDTQWPNACRKCNAGGLLRSPGGWVPYGMGNAQLPDDVDPCDCLEAGRCPRCAAATMTEEANDEGDIPPCSACGWNAEEAEGHRPEGFDGYCDCFEAAERENYRRMDEAQAERLAGY